ncbi:pseudouridine synthase [Reinekea marina]|uniref:Pseudouridine synthase n=1 Tax=Reinekea marina TaxID=1310421 RepID=A0ABV7WM63_9GAMM|nr:pseudouridine synthase [Reinekea marina]MDN3649340.1 pseudouridine synthase [Reinekea marina]
MNNLDIVFEDEDLLVVDKPAGLLMHPSWLDKREKDTLASRVKTYLNGAKVHTIHRLDRPTSGLVVIAKKDNVAKLLAAQFAERGVKKTYWAITRGFTPEHFIVNHELTEELDKIADKHASKDREAQTAITHFKRIGISSVNINVGRYPQGRYSLVECSPITGRKHQIRRHLKHERFPIIGDSKYGCRHNNQAAFEHLNMNSLALRAVRIEFIHPSTGLPISLETDKNSQWAQWFDRLGWQ